MTKRNKELLLLTFIIAISLSGCGFYFQDIERERAHKALQEGDYKQAVFHYTRIIKKSEDPQITLNAAREAAKISLFNLKDFFSAINFLSYVVLYSPSQEERIDTQEKIAFLYYDRLNDYEKAIEEYSKLVSLPLMTKDKTEYKFKIAKSFYYLNKFDQAITELNSILSQKLSKSQKFTYSLFKANVLITQKQFEEAIEEYRGLLDDFPERAKKEKLGLIVAVAYEDMNEFEKAIEILDEIKPDYDDPSFIEIKIKRLKERISNQPGKRKRR